VLLLGWRFVEIIRFFFAQRTYVCRSEMLVFRRLASMSRNENAKIRYRIVCCFLLGLVFCTIGSDRQYEWSSDIYNDADGPIQWSDGGPQPWIVGCSLIEHTMSSLWIEHQKETEQAFPGRAVCEAAVGINDGSQCSLGCVCRDVRIVAFRGLMSSEWVVWRSSGDEFTQGPWKSHRHNVSGE
jgi:hypothetical protein